MNIIYGLTNLANKTNDTPSERINKSVLMLTVLFKALGCITWIVMYYSLNLTLAYKFPLAYFFVLVITTLYLYLTKNFDVALYIYIFFIWFVPFLLQIVMGGFVNSGAVILWSLLAPLGALFFKGRKAGIFWFMMFILAAILSVIIKDNFNFSPPISLSETTTDLFFLMNIGVVCGFFFYTLVYFRQLTSKQNNELEQNYVKLSEQKQIVEKNNEILLQRNTEIAEQRDEILHQKYIIEEHQKNIIDSINYAKRLQQAILPPLELIKEKLPESFIIYKPKDIVAGDFYWMEEEQDTIFIAAADCTGHGVPGALVSVVCSNALNRAVKEFHIKETGAILNKVTTLVLETFEKGADDVRDGMDISILAINRSMKQIQWSGANNPLWYFENSTLVEIKADKQAIGKNDNNKNFSTHTIDYKPNTTFYLFTDGYADQFGGPHGKKLMTKQFKEILTQQVNNDIRSQQTAIETTFDHWKGRLEQVDDVCVIGIRL